MQQSESKPQAVPFPVHGSAQTFEALHVPEQQAPPVGQVRPFGVQVAGGWHVAGLPVHTPVQHSLAPPGQSAPFDLHGSAHWLEPLQ